MNRAFGTVAFLLAIAAAYEWFVDEAIASEAVAAMVVASLAYAAQRRLVRIAPPQAAVSLGFVVPFVRRVLPAVVRESFELLGPVLVRSLVLRRPVRGRWIALRFETADRSEAYRDGRSTIVVAASNLTPNALPLDVDLATGRLVLHQLVARREAAASDPRYPM